MKKKKRIVVAMSGGVDSSVAAALLKDEGYEVIGLTMRVLECAPEKNRPARPDNCCSFSAVEDARRAAGITGIPHYVLDLRGVFRQKVISNFISEYAAGRTPNPCIRCNRFVKFGALLRKAEELGAGLIATGHYAVSGYNAASGRWELRKGKDPGKDQSYVLYQLRQDQLKRCVFPLGSLKKKEVRAIARRKRLPNADRPESQEICFVPGNDYRKFLVSVAGREAAPGNILDMKGRKIGEHKGLAFYTIGQRKGLGISSKDPLYILSINKRKNEITAGPDSALFRSEFTAGEMNLISPGRLDGPVKARVKIRYRHKASPAVVTPDGKGTATVRFAEPQRAITPGQSAVFYMGGRVMGGGIIETVTSNQ